MAKFLKKVVFMLVPVLLFLVWLEMKARREDQNVLAIQRNLLYEQSDQIEGLILGTSQMKRAIDPAGLEPKTATLALSAGYLRTGVGLLEQALKVTEPKFVLFEFSAGYLDTWNVDKWQQQRKLFYYFGLPQSRQKLKDYFVMRSPLHRYLSPEPSGEEFNEYGFPLNLGNEKDAFASVNYDRDSIMLLRSTRRKIRQHNRGTLPQLRPLNEALLLDAIRWCRERNIHLVLLNPPKYYLYNQYLIDEHRQVQQDFIDKYVDGNYVHFWNFESWQEEEPRFFYNVTHLNYEGAQRFTEEVNRQVLALLGE